MSSNYTIRNNFPKGTIYEKELNLNFKYFNVFWYDPNKTNDFDLFKKCFENVKFYKNYDLKTIIHFFKTESIYEWIIITPGFQGKELISNLENLNCIKAFFIYCKNPKYHNWAKNIKKVVCITSDSKILCQKLIELNRNYIIPNFNYKSKENIGTKLDINDINSGDYCNFKLLPFKPLFEIKKETQKLIIDHL